MLLGAEWRHNPTPIRVFEVLESTQTEAIKALRDKKKGPCWIQAIEQTLGQGRRGRTWESLKGNLMASWYCVLNIEVAKVPQLALITALSVYDLIVTRLAEPQALKIKWPNDILYDHKKLCGILVQSEAIPSSHGVGVVIGIGLNLTQAPDIENYATTSLNKHSLIDTTDPIDWLKPLSHFFDLRIQQWLSQGFEPARQEWLALGYGLDQEIVICHDDQSFKAKINGLSETGALMVTDLNGQVHHLNQAQISYGTMTCSS